MDLGFHERSEASQGRWLVRSRKYSRRVPAVPGLSEEFKAAALAERERLQAEQAAATARVVDLQAQLAAAEEAALLVAARVREIEELLGLAPQLSLASEEGELRGARLREVALYVLQEQVGTEPVHYRRWFELVSASYRIAGKDPRATFLSAISRIAGIQKVGQRTGMYRLAAG
jgi:hypothetical protein